MDKYKISFILSHGVLLGVIRENRFLPHDSDIDLFLLPEAGYEKLCQAIAELNKMGYEPWETYKTPDGKIVHWTLNYQEIHISLKSLYLSKSGFFRLETGIGLGKRIPTIMLLPKELFDPPKEINFIGTTFLAPNPPEKYLELQYGNWKEVIKDRSWVKQKKLKIFFSDQCEESLWEKIIRIDEPARLEYLEKKKIQKIQGGRR